MLLWGLKCASALPASTQIEKGDPHQPSGDVCSISSQTQSGQLDSWTPEPADSRSTSALYTWGTDRRNSERSNYRFSSLCGMRTDWPRCADTYTFGDRKGEEKKRNVGWEGGVERRERHRQEMKEGLNLTKMNVGSLHLPPFTNTSTWIRRRREVGVSVIGLSLREEAKNNYTFLLIMMLISCFCPERKILPT